MLTRTKSLFAGILVLVLCAMPLLGLSFNLHRVIIASNTIIVPDQYSTIQGAINAASPGDIIFVRNGTYYENVLVNKTVNLIGENNETTIIDGGGYGTVVEVSTRGLPLGSTVDNVTIANLTITNSGSGSSDSGLTLDGVDGCNITGIIVTANHGDGIWLNTSWYNNIYGNSVNGNNFTGIALTYSEHNGIVNNNVVNTDFGIALEYSSSFNFVSSNNVTGSGEDGIHISYSSNNLTVILNTIARALYGLYIGQSMYTEVCRNQMYDNFLGAYLDSSSYNFLSKNTFRNNYYGLWLGNSPYNCIVRACITSSSEVGIYLGLSSHNTFARSSIKGSGRWGVYLDSSSSNIFRKDEFVNDSVAVQLYNASDNSIVESNVTDNNETGFSFTSSSSNSFLHNNIISNYVDVTLDGNSANTWDNGSIFSEGGNYWSNYTGVDPNHTGIGNTPQVLNVNNTDHYPLMGPYSSYNSSRGILVVITNSTIQNLNYYSINSTLTMRVSNMTLNQTSAFARFTIPYTMMNVSSVRVYVDNGTTPLIYYNYYLYDNGTTRWIYIIYPMSTHTIDVVPELSPPLILSPQNNAYNVNSIPLTFTFERTASWMGYSLDGQANITITGNTTLTGLPDGLHSIIVYANDTFGNMGVSPSVNFTIDTVPPNITNVVQTPAVNNVEPQDTVEINATVTDALSGVKQVLLNYTNGNGTWITVTMTNIEGNIWNASIGSFPNGTYVNYTVVASDNAGNQITTEQTLGYQYQYRVIPEFPSFLVLPIMLVLLLTTVVYQRKRTRSNSKKPQ